MKTSLWGPSAWTFLHAVSFAYPEDPSPEHKEAALNLFSSLQLLLPCGDCCSHYCSTFQRKDLLEHLESKDTFSKWLVKFHNQVNKRLKKPEYSYDQAKAYYLNDEATCAIQSPCGEDHITQTGQPLQKATETKKLLVFTSTWVVIACVVVLLFFMVMARKK
jgi:hypothetical protein